MHLNEIRATAFGPFRGSSLDLAPGMNVIHGPNEAGKSSWFAAAYAGLAGRRKARGRGTMAQADFRNRHKPWSGAQWSAGVTLTLDDGLVLALEHDLAKGESRVVDVNAGQVIPLVDLAKRLGLELTTESTLDGTRLLGLNRDSARATIFTGQADVLRVLQDASELQEFLERAATSEVADTTAEGALAWLGERRSEYVGSEHVGRKPLRTRGEEAEQAREVTNGRRDQLVRLVQVASERRSVEAQLLKAKSDVDHVDQLERWAHIGSLQTRLRKAQALATQLETSSYSEHEVDEDRIREATTILGAYEAGSDAQPLPEGATAAELLAEVAALPTSPEGDLEPRREILDGRDEVARSATALETHRSGAPAAPPAAVSVELGPDELRAMADSLEVMAPAAASGLSEELDTALLAEGAAATRYAEEQRAYEAAIQRNNDRRLAHDQAMAEHERLSLEFESALARQAEELARRAAARDARDAAETVASAKKKRANGVAAAGGLLTLLAVALTLIGPAALGLALALVGIASVAVGLLSGRSRPMGYDDAGVDAAPPALAKPQAPAIPQLDEVRAPDAPTVNPRVMELRVAFKAHENALRQHGDSASAVQSRLAEHSLEADPALLRKLARSIEDAEGTEERRQRHQDQEQALRRHRDSALVALAALLGERADGAPTDGDVSRLFSVVDAYVAGCRERAVVAQAAGRRDDLTAALEQRKQLEAARAIAASERERQGSAVAAFANDLTDADQSEPPAVEAAVARLRDWLAKQQRQRKDHAVGSELTARLDQLLEGRALDEWQQELAELVETVGPEPDDVPDDLTALRAQVARRHEMVVGRVGALAGQQEQLSRDLGSVAQAVEDEAAAERALAEVESLRTCIDAAVAQLKLAKDRAHANIAPALEARVRPLLPQITGGRYLDVRVDPSDLTVKVTEASGAVREARLLSQGTMEQIFLLLRIALSQVLSGGQESSPLILDDVTVQSDQGRTLAILDMLHRISAEHQVVLFTQEQEVIDWAVKTLVDERNKVVSLA